MVQLAGRRRYGSGLATFAISLGLCAFGLATTLSTERLSPQLLDRTKLLELQREAVTLLQRAARADASPDDVRQALVEAGRRLEALGAEPHSQPEPNRD